MDMKLLVPFMAEFDEFLEDPTLFLNRIHLSKGVVEFMSADRAAIADETFLNDHAQRKTGIWARRKTAPLKGLLEAFARKKMRAPDGFIFHTAMAGSTLLARCLDVPGKCLSIKEPQALGDLINARRLGEAKGITQAQWKALIRFAGCVLAKTAAVDERVVIKVSNKANALAGEIHSAFPEARILLLYSALQPFMISMLKRGQPSWEYCRNLLKALFADAGGADQKTLWNALEYTDLQIAPLVWHLQFDNLAAFQAQTSPARVRSLDCEEFFGAPAETLARLAAFFCVPFDRALIEDIIEREVRGRHAKDPNRAFSPEARALEHAQAAEKFQSELAFVSSFCRKIRPDITGPRILGGAL